MAEHRLKALAPLGAHTARVVRIGPLEIREVVDVAMASLAARLGREAEVATLASKAGIALPAAGKSAVGAVYTTLWLGPEQWMIEAPFASHEDFRPILLELFHDTASITEQTDAWVRFDLEAADLPLMFERLCALDTRKMAVGDATRTVIEHLGSYVVKRSNTVYSVIAPRSAAASLFHALETAARSVY